MNITGVAIAAPQSYYLEAYNSAGAASSETQTLEPLPEVTDPEATVARLTIGQAVGVVTAVAVVLVVLLLLVMFVATVSRRMRTEKQPAFLSHNFEPEKAGVVRLLYILYKYYDITMTSSLIFMQHTYYTTP